MKIHARQLFATALLSLCCAGMVHAQETPPTAEDIQAQCAAKPEQCDAIKARAEQAKAKCAADAACSAKATEARAKAEQAKAACAAAPETCEAKKAEFKAGLKARKEARTGGSN